jgi:hypothetical protein
MCNFNLPYSRESATAQENHKLDQTYLLIPFLFCKTFDTEFKRNSSNYCSAMFRIMNGIGKKGYGVHLGKSVRADEFFSETTFHYHSHPCSYLRSHLQFRLKILSVFFFAVSSSHIIYLAQEEKYAKYLK